MAEVPTLSTPRPLKVDIPNPIHSKAKDTRACLFVKDPEREFKDMVEDMNIPCMAEVKGYKELMHDFGQFKDKRQLCADYDLFFSDIRVYKMLPKCLGRTFYEKKKYPYPVKLHKCETTADLEKLLNSLTDATYFYMGNGPNYALRVARTDQTSEEAVANIIAAIPQMLGYITMRDSIKMSRVQAISLKMTNSIDLPIFH
jgi:ribosome biogenesis protein UTP30